MRWEQQYINSTPHRFMHNQADCISFGFVPINLIFQHSQPEGRPDPYFDGRPDDAFEKFKTELVEKGTFWPVIVTPFEFDYPSFKKTTSKLRTTVDSFGQTIPLSHKLIIREGNHRMKAWHELAKEGRIPKDFLVPTVISMTGYPYFSGDEYRDSEHEWTIQDFPRFDNYRLFWRDFQRMVLKIQQITVDDKSIIPCKEMNEQGFIPTIDIDKFINI